MKCNILAFGVHPDDLEIGIFGTLLLHIQKGYSVVAIDLTAGEMGSNGNPLIREKESEDSRRVAGIQKRYQLGLRDRGITSDETSLLKVVNAIREHQPDFVLYPYERDYHPDHENASRLIKEALHLSGLKKYLASNQSPHKVKRSGQYYINDVERVNHYVDISAHIDIKRKCLECHASQFIQTDQTVRTYLNQDFINRIIQRDGYHGMICGTDYAEAVHLDKPQAWDCLPGVALGGELDGSESV